MTAVCSPGMERVLSDALERSGTSLWRQITDRLDRAIAAGLVEPGARLPTEAVLSARFGVNRHTVRRALEELSRRGLIRVEQGRGTFVAEDVLDYKVAARTRFSEWIRRYNKEPSGRLLDLRRGAADAQIAAGLGIRTGATVITLQRLDLADGRPIAVSSHHFSNAAMPRLFSALSTLGTISAALASIGVPDYTRRSTRVTARLPTASEADLLRMLRTQPLLVCENVNVGPDGQIIEFGVAAYPTPRVQVVFEP